MRFLTLFLLLYINGLSLSVVYGQDDSASVYFQREFELQLRMRSLVQKPTHLIRHAKPVRGFTIDESQSVPLDPWGESTALQLGDGHNDNSDLAREALDHDRGPHIAIVGDGLAQDLARGMSDSFAERHDVTLLQFLNSSARLGRDDAGDVGTLLHDILMSKTRVDVVVVMLGFNDIAAAREAAGQNALDANMMHALAERASLFVRQLRARKIDVIWVGMPIVKAERLAGDLDAFNSMMHTQLTPAEAVFIDVWDGFQDDRGLYAAYGPDINGQTQKMRLSDGVHFTRAGARNLAYFVEGDLRAVVDVRRGVEPVVLPPSSPMDEPSEPGNADAPHSRPDNSVTRESFGLVIPLPPAIGDIYVPVHPLAGPVQPLTNINISLGGELVRAGQKRMGARTQDNDRAVIEAERLIDRVFGAGHVVEPRHGRTDDFRWPRSND